MTSAFFGSTLTGPTDRASGQSGLRGGPQQQDNIRRRGRRLEGEEKTGEPVSVAFRNHCTGPSPRVPPHPQRHHRGDRVRLLASLAGIPRLDTGKMPAALSSAPWILLVAATAAVLLVQVLGDGAPAKPATAAQPSEERIPEAPPPAAEGGAEVATASPKKPKSFGHPFNLGINIPYFFNMRLLTGPAGTGLGLSVPAILSLQLDATHRRSPGLLLNLFGNRRILFNRRRRPGNSLAGSAPPFGQPSEQDNAIDIKRKPTERLRGSQDSAIAP